MPNWKKVIVSGSTASLSKLNVATSVTASSYTGSFVGDGSQLTGVQASVSEVTGSLVVSGSNTTIGTSVVSGSFVTTGSFAVTAKGVGTAWSAGANLTSRWGLVAAVGTQTSGLAWGGNKQGYENNANKHSGDTEEYDGTNWSIGGTRPGYTPYYSAGFGTQTAAVSFGGKSYITGYETDAVHKYDGSSWSAGNNLPGALQFGGGAGTQTAGLVAGGQHLYAYAYYLDTTYEYDGTNWTTGGTLPELGFTDVTIAGTQTDAILLGNSSASIDSKQSAATYDGTSWTTVASIDSELGSVVGSKADYALAVNSGLGNSTFIWTGTNWAVAANSLTTRTIAANGDGSGGSDSSGFIVGGRNGSTSLTSTEEFDNSISTVTGLNVTKELNQNVSATGSFYGKFKGDGSELILDTNVVFDDEANRFTKNIHFANTVTHTELTLTGSGLTDLRIGYITERHDQHSGLSGFEGVRISTGSFGHYLDKLGWHKKDEAYQVQAPTFTVSKDHDGSMELFPGILWPWASSSIYHHLPKWKGNRFYEGLHFDFGGVSGITASADIVIEPSGSLIVAPKNGGNFAVSGSILPGTNEAYDLGSSTHRWRDIYLSGSTIDLGGTKISRDSTGDIEFKVDGNRKSLKVDELHIGSGAGARKLKVSSGRLKFTTISDSKELDSTTDITASAIEANGSTLGNFTVAGNLTVNGSILGASAAGTGSTSITTLGTISSGTWQGSAIGDNYISSATTWNGKLDSTGTITNGDFAQFNADGDLVGRSATETKSDLSLAAGDVGLGNVTNESKATMFTSPTFTGTPVAPTPTSNDDSTKIATTAYVQQELTDLIGTAPSTLDTLGELSASLANDQDALNSLTITVGQKLAKSSNLSDLTNASSARTNLGLGSLATLSSVNASTITDNSVGAAELNVSGNGSSTQFLRSDGDGTFSWAVPTNTTYSVGDGGLTQNNFTDALKTKLDGIATSANNYSHPTHPGDDFSVDTGALTGATVVSDIDINVTTDTLGHVTDANGSVSTRTLTLADLGFTGDSNANYITSNSEIDNAEGYTSYSSNQTLNNNSNVHFEGLMVGQTSGATANTIRCVGDIVAYYSSDQQFKDNVETLEGALDKIKAIRGVRFDWNDKQDVYEGHDIGVIAQEVETVLPELVHYRDHNDSKAVDYVKLTAVLIEAVKELSAKVDKLENK